MVKYGGTKLGSARVKVSRDVTTGSGSPWSRAECDDLTATLGSPRQLTDHFRAARLIRRKTLRRLTILGERADYTASSKAGGSSSLSGTILSFLSGGDVRVSLFKPSRGNCMHFCVVSSLFESRINLRNPKECTIE